MIFLTESFPITYELYFRGEGGAIFEGLESLLLLVSTKGLITH